MEAYNVKSGLMRDGISDLLSVYISEDNLNLLIANTEQDLSMLRTALELKLSLILHNKHSPIGFSVDSILDQIQNTSIDEICLTLQLALLVQCNELQYEVLLKHVNKNLCNTNDECNLKSTLKLLQLALSLCDLEMREKAFKRFVMINNFHDTICNLLFSDSKAIVNFISVYILPKYLKDDNPGSAHILQVIWKNALATKNLNILCAIPEFFLLTRSTPICSYSLVNLDAFWFLLQENLNCSNSSFQKQASYLLKQAILSIGTRGNFITESKVVFWDLVCKEEVISAWNNLFMLFEISREKQLHLIEPSYQLLPTIKILHPSWLICIYKILLTHPHTAVSAYAVLDILDSRWYQDVNVFKTVIRCLLSSLNKTECVDKEEIWKKLRKFADELDNEKFILLLQGSSTMLWIPAVCYQFYRSVINWKRQIIISFNLTENILNNIEKLPHKFIRSGCIELIVGFISKMFLSSEQFNFKDYITLSWILYKDKYVPYNNIETVVNFEKYRSDIQNIIITWSHSAVVDLKEFEIILKIIELPLLEDDWFNEHVVKPFLERKFLSEISDGVCMLLYARGIICSSMLCKYVQGRLVHFTSVDTVKKFLPLLITTKRNEIALLNLFSKCTEIVENQESNILQIEIAFEIITVLLERIDCTVSLKSVETVLNSWKQKYLKDNRKLNTNICLSFLHLYCTKEFYKISIYNKERPMLITSEKLVEAITIFEKMIQTENNNVIPEIFMQLKYLLDLCEDVQIVFCFIDTCLKKLLELKRTDVFKIALERFTQSILSNSKICSYNKDVLEKILNILWKLLEFAKSSDEVAYIVVKQLHGLSNINANILVSFIPVVVELLLFGDILKKDQRAEYIVCQLIDTDRQRMMDENNPNFRRLLVRALAINIVQKILSSASVTQEDKSKQADAFALVLMDKYHIHFNKRYFAISNIHLQKLRILQALLILHNHIKMQKQPLIDVLVNSLCSENHQVSVKFFIQWLLILLLHENDQCLLIITSKMESTSKVHSSTIIAFIPILYHIALWRNDEAFWINLFEIMLPWTMGAHFNLRLYAQEGIKKLYEVACKKGFVNVREKFKSSADCITQVLEKTERKIDLLDRYVFNDFNAKEHYHLNMIYFNIPKITNITCDEYENILNIEEFSVHSKINGITEYEVMQLSQDPIERFKDKPYTSMIQKKITPWSQPSGNGAQRIIENELIVVASLIDKTPNLGGLSRTCEVFGIKQLVISTTNIVKDQEFQSISMSSENWVDILETKVDHLRSFLLDLKEKGYSVIGAEQTSGSIQLHVLKFPKKCVLLLGNEKEGIPPNLLSLIDLCVEIPQFGVVRSLNVHVAAATFIWEYTKQHTVLSNSLI